MHALIKALWYSLLVKQRITCSAGSPDQTVQMFWLIRKFAGHYIIMGNGLFILISEINNIAPNLFHVIFFLEVWVYFFVSTRGLHSRVPITWGKANIVGNVEGLLGMKVDMYQEAKICVGFFFLLCPQLWKSYMNILVLVCSSVGL